MTIYSTVTIILLILFFIEQKGVSEKQQKIFFYISAFIILFIMAFRGDNVGGDTIEYCHFWEGKEDQYGTWKSPNILLVNEPGLTWLSGFLHVFFDNSPFNFIFITSLLTLLPFLYLVWRDSKYKVLPILLYMQLWGVLDITYTAIRQVIGVSLCIIAYIIWSSKIKSKNKRILFITLFLAFAISFHSAVYFTIPMFIGIIFLKDINKKIACIALPFSFLIGFVSSNFLTNFYQDIGNVFSGIDFLFRLDQYFSAKYSLNNNALGMRQALITAMICLYILCSDKVNVRSFNMKCLIIGCVLFNLFAPYPNAGRFLYSLLFVGITSSPNLLNVNNLTLYKYGILTLLIILTIHQIFSWESGYNNHLSDYYVFNQMFPYKFIWE